MTIIYTILNYIYDIVIYMIIIRYYKYSNIYIIYISKLNTYLIINNNYHIPINILKLFTIMLLWYILIILKILIYDLSYS